MAKASRPRVDTGVETPGPVQSCRSCGNPSEDLTAVGGWCLACRCQDHGCQMFGAMEVPMYGRRRCLWHYDMKDDYKNASRFEVFSHWLAAFRGKYGKSQIYKRSPLIVFTEAQLWAMVGGQG